MRGLNPALLIFLTIITFLGVSNAHSFNPKDVIQVKTVEMSINGVHFFSEPTTKNPVRFVVNGLFPNTCYTYNRMDVEHVNEFFHKVRVLANVKQTVCLMVLTPFTIEGDLGLLAAGQHQVLFVAGDGTSLERSIKVQ
jgi:hypothetical protein